MRVRAARGAIVVGADTPEQVLDATQRLLSAMLDRNAVETGDLISILFTATDDLHLRVPGRGRAPDGHGRGAADVRQGDPVEGAMTSVVRDPDALPLRADPRRGVHVYLDGAESLAMTSILDPGERPCRRGSE